jgi:hypothetical protein
MKTSHGTLRYNDLSAADRPSIPVEGFLLLHILRPEKMAGMDSPKRKNSLSVSFTNLLLTPVFFYALIYATKHQLVWLEWTLVAVAVIAVSRVLFLHFKSD